MKKLLSLVIAAVILVSALASCGESAAGENLLNRVKPDENSSYHFTSGKTTSPTAYNSYKTAAMDFSFNMLRSLKDSAAYSPMALYYQLSLLQNAASDDTRGNIRHLTGEAVSLDELNECNGYFFSRLEKLGRKKSSYIDLNGSFFFNEKTPVSQSFLLTDANFYKQEVYRLNFSDSDFSNKVNAYLNETTNGKASFNKKYGKSSGLMLLDNIFMNDNWLTGYKSGDITEDTFNGSKKSDKKSFLKSTEFYLKGQKCEGIIKDFKNTPAKFIAILPKEKNINKFLNGMNSDLYFDLIKSLKVTKTCDAYIPEFTEKEDINLAESEKLKFLNDKGSYTPLAYNTKFKTSDIIQSFEINISRGGIGSAKSSPSKIKKPKAEKTLKFNRPFIYMVVDNESYLPLIMGIADNI